MNLTSILFVFIGGGAGSVLRFLISKLVQSQTAITLPVATLVANVLSVIVYALVVLYVSGKNNPEYTRLLLLTGFCGGLSTFSTFSYETFELFQRGNSLFAWGNIILNNLLCIGLFALIVKRIPA